MSSQVASVTSIALPDTGGKVDKPARVSIIALLAEKYSLDAKAFLEAVKSTLMPSGATDAQTAAFLVVCNRYDLDPFTREIYAFPTKAGGIQPVVAVDGWLNIMNAHPAYDGYEYAENLEQGRLVSGTIKVFRTDRSRPTVHTEYFSEAKRNTDPWNNMPHRMLENRTSVQGIRRAFGIKGLMDVDEASALSEINITRESSEMQRTSSEQGKEVLAAIRKRRGAVTEGAAAAPAVAAPAIAPPATGPTLPLPASMDDLIDQPPTPVPSATAVQQDPMAKLTEPDRVVLINILKGRPGEIVAKSNAMREKIQSLGFTNTKEITYSAFDELVKWASELTIK